MKLKQLLFIPAAIVMSTSILASAETQCSEPIGPEAALDAGVTAVFESHMATNFLNGEGGFLGSVTYQGLEDFLARNPGCCTFSRSGSEGFVPTPEWQERYSFYGFVSATYKAYRVKDGAAEKEVDRTTEVAITTCGKAIWYDMDDDNW